MFEYQKAPTNFNLNFIKPIIKDIKRPSKTLKIITKNKQPKSSYHRRSQTSSKIFTLELMDVTNIVHAKHFV